MINDVEMVLGKSELGIGRCAIRGPGGEPERQRFFARIRAEFDLAARIGSWS